jgi:hypothetical protein
MKAKNLATRFLAMAAAAAPDLQGQTSPDTRVLPFQGRLTDADGNAVTSGSRVVQFKIYDAPVGGRAVWNGEVHNLTVNGGLVSTLLGTRASLSGVNFNLDLYLEVTIDANADGQISLADPPLLPRQSIVPAVFAKESANSLLLGGYDWTALFGTNNPAEGTLLASKIGDQSLTTAKIRDGAVNTSKIANGAVTRPKLDTKGASPGQALIYNGSEVVWSQINAVAAETAADAQKLKGFDWTALFNDGNPQSGTLSAAHLASRGNLHVAGDSTQGGRVLFNGPSVTVLGELLAPTLGINMFLNNWGFYLRGLGDFNHYIKWGNALGSARDYDGPEIVGNGGGVLGTVGNWSLRWNWNGTVQSRGSFSNGSDRNIKENFTALHAVDILDKVLALPITRWNYKDDPEAQHIGPVSQDFHAAFQVGSNDKFIATVDADGVALAAIQGLHQKLVAQENEIRELVTAQQRLIDDLKAELAALRTAR